MNIRLFIFSIFAMLCVSQVNANTTITVQYTGCVEETNVIFKHQPSLLELLKFPTVKPCAYSFATALMQPQLLSIQKDQKERLLNNIQLLQLNENSTALNQYLRWLKGLIQLQPITGRVLGLELDSTRVEIIPLQNKIFSNSLTLHFPKRLRLINFIGANKDQMYYRPVLTLDDYLTKNPLFDFFEKGYVYVVQANAEVERVKVGYWNHQKHYLSPGSWVIGLLKPSVIDGVAPSFNEDLSKWLATQVLP